MSDYKAYVTVYQNLTRDSHNAQTQVPMHPPLAEYVLNISQDGDVSPPFPAHAHFIELISHSDCFIAIGTNPVATNTHFVLADERIFCGVDQGMKISIKGA